MKDIWTDYSAHSSVFRKSICVILHDQLIYTGLWPAGPLQEIVNKQLDLAVPFAMSIGWCVVHLLASDQRRSLILIEGLIMIYSFILIKSHFVLVRGRKVNSFIWCIWCIICDIVDCIIH